MMEKLFYYIFRDGTMIGRTSSRQEAVEMIRRYQARETHPFLRAEFSIIRGLPEEYVKYN